MPDPWAQGFTEEAGESLAEGSEQGAFLETFYGTEGPEASPAGDPMAERSRRA